MTVAEILDALYDGIGASWVSDMSFVDEVAEWVERTKEDEACSDGEEDQDRLARPLAHNGRNYRRHRRPPCP